MRLKQSAIFIVLAVSLAACNSTDATLGVEGTTPPPSIATPSTTQNVATSAVRLRFAPIIGAPVDKVTPLSRRLSARAKERSIPILASTDQTATHVLKGYFSLLAEGQSSSVIYVFDVLDPSGNRLTRIQGQESVPSINATNDWTGVSSATMETIADKAMSALTTWLVTSSS